MSSVEKQIAQIQKELMALTGNQPPNPSQIATFRVDRTTTVNEEIKTIVWDDGAPRFIQLFYLSDTSVSYIYKDGSDLKVKCFGNAGSQYVLVSLGAFSLV